ncbi:PG1 protein, partial [Bifidobacterium hapali]
AASLHQACAHCAIFPTAASRRSLGRISVPMWPVALSGRLPVKATVGHHPTVKLIGRDPIPYRKKAFPQSHAIMWNIQYYHPFPGAIPKYRAGQSRITHPFATLTQTEV